MQLSWLVATIVLGELAYYYTAMSWIYNDDQVQFETLQHCKKINTPKLCLRCKLGVPESITLRSDHLGEYSEHG